MLQRLIYEKSNDINNALLECHTTDVYLDNKGSYYRTKMPDQLKKDLICIAYLNGFIDEPDRYEKLLNTILVKAVIRPKEKKNKNKTEEEKKKEMVQREALALGLHIFNFAKEKADTRNWQSLPHTSTMPGDLYKKE